MAALSQLSYSPFEGEFICKGSTRTLAVARRNESKPEFVLANESHRRQEKRLVEIRAVDGE
jgi:hypothetical protein